MSWAILSNDSGTRNGLQKSDLTPSGYYDVDPGGNSKSRYNNKCSCNPNVPLMPQERITLRFGDGRCQPFKQLEHSRKRKATDVGKVVRPARGDSTLVFWLLRFLLLEL